MSIAQDVVKLDSHANATIDTIINALISYGLNILGAIIIFIIGWHVARYAKSFFTKTMKKAKADVTLTLFLANLIRYAIITFTVIAVLQKFGVQTTSLVAVLGAAGIAIGLALQGTLSHIAAGVMLLFFRPFKVGDFVESAGQTGTIQEINMFTTEMNTPDNKRIIIPNSHIWNGPITNYSANNSRRVDLEIGIDYADDINLAFKVINDVLKKEKLVLSKPEPLIAVDNLGDSSVNITVRAWVKKADYLTAKFTLTKTIKEAIDANGMSIPFPQQTLHFAAPVDIASLPTTKKK